MKRIISSLDGRFFQQSEKIEILSFFVMKNFTMENSKTTTHFLDAYRKNFFIFLKILDEK